MDASTTLHNAAPVSARTRAVATAVADVRYRWRIGSEAQGMVLVSAVLLAFGLAVLYSASSMESLATYGNGSYFFFRQLSGVVAGVAVFAVAAKVDAERLHKFAWPLMWLTLAAMLLVLVLPNGIAPKINGSKRFLFATSIQPSELAKLAVVIWVSMLIVKKGDTLRRLSKGLIPFLIVIGVLDALTVVEPNVSAAMIVTLITAVLLYAGGARMAHFIFLCALTLPLAYVRVDKLQYVVVRIASFIDPSSAPRKVAYQLHQSFLAVGPGGWFGRGFGEGFQQFGFLPYPYTDFIAANIGEEWGFAGIAATTLAFAVYGALGFRIARQARSPFLQLVAIGLTFATVLTAYLHIGVVIGLLPNAGITLPFISYGRSNLVLTMLFTGILVNIGSTKERVIGSRATDPMAAPTA